MTREEAVEVIKDFVAYGKHVNAFVYKGSTAIPIEALNMAIAALKQLSLPKIIIRQGEQEPCDKRTDKRTETHACDCISRQDAIEALDQEETLQNLTKPNKSDLISRQAAIDTVMGFMPSLTTPDGCGQFDREIFEAQEMFVDIGQALNKLPSAQPFTTEQIQTMQELESAQVEKAFELGKADRPTGHWIEHDDERVLCECSECHEKYLLYEEHVLGRNFCPNCGCAMKGGEEE